MSDSLVKNLTRVVYYDLSLDCEAVRYIGHSGHGAYVVTCPLANAGARRRQQQAEIIGAINDAIRAGDPPGDVSPARVIAARRWWALENQGGKDGEQR